MSAQRRLAAWRTLGVLIALLLLTGVRVEGQNMSLVSVIRDDDCPVDMIDVRREMDQKQGGVAVVYTVRNPGQRTVKGMIVTLALIDAGSGVSDLRLETVDTELESGAERELRVVFEGRAIRPDERVAFGIQAVRWSRSEEWRGALPLVIVPFQQASTRVR